MPCLDKKSRFCYDVIVPVIDNGTLKRFYHTMNKRPTIKQVAEAAGVSTQTVSRVINNRPDVAADTRKRIEEIIDNVTQQSLLPENSTYREVTFPNQVQGITPCYRAAGRAPPPARAGSR